MTMHQLFSYGTLQYEQVQRELFGRVLSGVPDTLCSYIVADLKIRDAEVIRKSGTDIHPILKFTGVQTDEVVGTIYEISDVELAHADAYEIKDYSRQKVKFKSGAEAWVYAASDEEENK